MHPVEGCNYFGNGDETVQDKNNVNCENVQTSASSLKRKSNVNLTGLEMKD